MALFLALSNLPLPWELLPIVLLGTMGFARVGTLFGAISVNTRTREVMLPILLFPVIVPVIIAAVKATGVVFAGGSLGEAGGWLSLPIGLDAILLVVAFITFEYVLEE